MSDTDPENPRYDSAWHALREHQELMAQIHMRQLFQDDSSRAQKFSVQLESLMLDYSKHRITDNTLELLISLAESCQLEQKISALFSGFGGGSIY